MTDSKADANLAEFLRRIMKSNNNVSPVTVIYGPGEVTADQESTAYRRASLVRDMGYIESRGTSGWGADGDLDRVSVTLEGRQWLAEYERRT